MEADILKSLNFEMGNPTLRTFLRLGLWTFSFLVRVDDLSRVTGTKTGLFVFTFISFFPMFFLQKIH